MHLSISSFDCNPFQSRFILWDFLFLLFFLSIWQVVDNIFLLIFDDKLSSLISWDVFSICVESKWCDSWWVLWELLFLIGLIIFDSHPFDLFVLKFINRTINSPCTPNIIRIPDIDLHPWLEIVKSFFKIEISTFYPFGKLSRFRVFTERPPPLTANTFECTP